MNKHTPEQIRELIEAARAAGELYTKNKRRRVCDSCGEKHAVVRHQYVKPDQYAHAGKFSSDFDLHQCNGCDNKDDETLVPDCFRWNGTYLFGSRFDHLFHETVEVKFDADTLLSALEQVLERVEALEKDHNYCRPEVQGFARLMEAALRAKDGERGGNSWQHQTMVWEIAPHLQSYTSRVRERIGKAQRLSDDFDVDMELSEAAENAVHAANYAMMIVDICGTLPRTALQEDNSHE